MSARYTELAADIKDRLTPINGIGFLHTYERQSTNIKKFLELFTDQATGIMTGGEITRRAVPEHQRGAYFRHHQMVLKYYMGLQDEAGSSELFQDRIDDICDVFRAAGQEAATGSWYYGNGDEADKSAVQVEQINDRMFGNVLCHCAVIAINITERIII